jgi:hypothetical protein
MDNDPYAALLHTGMACEDHANVLVDKLNKSYQTLLQKHESLKTQNDDILVRVGLQQQFALNPVLKGKQMEEDERRAGIGESAARDDGGSREPVGLVGTSRR